jgi:hypothetical protein
MNLTRKLALALGFAMLSTTVAQPALAGGGHHGGGGHGHFVVGIGIGAPYWGWGYGYGYPYYPGYYYPPAYAYPAYPAQPTTYIQQDAPPAPAAPQQGYWYYCGDAQAYYPYVKECPGGWQRVSPQPAR